jgi:hypothetical protein
MSIKVNNPGEWHGIHKADTSNSIVFHWSKAQGSGRKRVVSNPLTKTRSKIFGNLSPFFNLHKPTFSCCDNIKTALHDATWPFQKCGYQRSGGQSAEYNFLFTCILHFSFDYYSEILKRPHSKLDFKRYCLVLGDQLFEYASHMNN